jgi:catalase
MSTRAEQAVDSMNKQYGTHPHSRAVHAKGIVCAGNFRATPEAAELTRAAHMQGTEIPVTARFSNGGGNPHHGDGVPDGRGFATKFYLPDGSRTDIVALSLPVFLARTPEDFLELTKASSSLLGRIVRVPPYVLTHREVLPGLRAFTLAQPPKSYATYRYNGIHAFRWLDADGGGRFVRYRWDPDAGHQTINPIAARRKPKDYLQTELAERLEREPARFTLSVKIAEPGDTTDDSTKAWPDSRETVVVGHLTLTAIDTSREQDGDILVFDPTRVTDGIELSDDPILRFRSEAYSVSVERRAGAPRGAEAEPGAKVGTPAE